jgi:hypothetical protein
VEPRGGARRRDGPGHRPLLLLHVASGPLRHDDDRVARVGPLLPARRPIRAGPDRAPGRLLPLRGWRAREQGSGRAHGAGRRARAGPGGGRLAGGPVAAAAARPGDSRAVDAALAPAVPPADRAELRRRGRGSPLRRLVPAREAVVAARGAARQPGTLPALDRPAAGRGLVVVARPGSPPPPAARVDGDHRGRGEPLRRAARALLRPGAPPDGAPGGRAAGRRAPRSGGTPRAGRLPRRDPARGAGSRGDPALAADGRGPPRPVHLHAGGRLGARARLPAGPGRAGRGGSAHGPRRRIRRDGGPGGGAGRRPARRGMGLPGAIHAELEHPGVHRRDGRAPRARLPGARVSGRGALLRLLPSAAGPRAERGAGPGGGAVGAGPRRRAPDPGEPLDRAPEPGAGPLAGADGGSGRGGAGARRPPRR